MEDLDSLPRVIIISVMGVKGAGGREERDESDCIGIMDYGNAAKKITRHPGESIESLDNRLEQLLPRDGMRVPAWVRVYQDDNPERMETFMQADEIA
ncbi:hypothetical protein [Comamonas sp. SY3]|uniref:hypothetical protein n=1 Tax=Comamonas sp. SY3 TaxID=3243601 RepID=UPI003593F58C